MPLDDVPTNKKREKVDASQEDSDVVDVETYKKDKKDSEDPKPRIVLTFRSDKSGAKSNNMKIVSTEEKHEETPRRSSRNRSAKWESDDDDSPKKDKSQVVSESDETSDSSRPKHSTRRRGRDASDVIANAIARKEKYNESASTSTRPSRRIKPTAKVLANEELRMGLESQNNARLGITDKSPEDGVRTRRSAQRNTETKKPVENTVEESDNSEMKLKHLCGLGLKSVEKTEEEPMEVDLSRDSEGEQEEGTDDDTEVIVKLLEADEESGSVSSGDYFLSKGPTHTDVERPRRSRRLCSMYGTNDSDHSSPIQLDDEPLVSTRRSTRRGQTKQSEESESTPAPKRQRGNSSGEEVDEEEEHDETSVEASVAPDEGPMAASPTGSTTIFAACCCEENTNIHAAESELTEPVFCQAIEVVDGLRVGCSHKAQRDGSLLAMRRAGPRAPYLLLCKLHTAQLEKHMCCPACGFFCTHGTFYQCSEGHLFHTECSVPFGEARAGAGCAHCGVRAYPWRAVNTRICKVQITMHCSNKRVYLPDQRETCTPAYLGFAPIEESKVEKGPIFSEDLLAVLPDLESLCDIKFETEENCNAQTVYEAIIAGVSVETLIPKIVKSELNVPIADIEGGTSAHAAAARGRLRALCVLQHAGADLDATDNTSKTPLMKAILALLEKKPAEEMEISMKITVKTEEGDVEVKTEESQDDSKVSVKQEYQETDKDDLMRVIKYLLAVGCDPNIEGPEGMTALHLAAQHGGTEVCALLVDGGARVDARDAGGWTPLVRAVENCHPHVAKLLLKEGADPTCTDNEGNAAVHWCVVSGDARCLHVLLDAAPHQLNTPNAHADTPLHIAAREGHYPCVVILLARGARTDIENSSAELAVHVSTEQCRGAILLAMKVAAATGGPFNKYRIIDSDLSNGREPYPVSCVNEEDDEPPPSFTYVSRHVITDDIHIDNTLHNSQSCECTDGTCAGTCACAVVSVRAWYRGGRLLPSFPHDDPPMIFECDHTCTCNLKRCTNRVVGRVQAQGSLAVPVQVFRTRGGWGLRTRHRVRRGALVALYCGELVTTATADTRPHDEYLLALEVKQDLIQQCSEPTQLCVDAAKYGSAARFINHSCRPNLALVRVFTECRDLRLPNVALFAVRDIAPLDELTFDYGDKFWSVKSKVMKCECGTPECRYPTISTGDEVEA